MMEAVFFDLDGTLMDSELLYVEAVAAALHHRGRDLSQEEALELVYGRSWNDIYRDVVKSYPETYRSIEEMEKTVEFEFKTLATRDDIRLKSSIELLRELSEDHSVAIVSGSTRRAIAEAIEYMEIEPHVGFYLGSEDYSPGKPDPSCYLKAAEIAGADPGDCLVFEDSSAGVRAAKDAGMYCVALQRDGLPPQDFTAADLILADLSEFDLTEFESGLS